MTDIATTSRDGGTADASGSNPDALNGHGGSSPSPGTKISDNAMAVLTRRYLACDDEGRTIETPDALFRRVANAIAESDRAYGGDVERTAESFYRLMSSLDFLPNSPCLMNAGRELGQLSACFVLPVPDSIDGIFTTLKHQAVIHQSGGGTGFSFSRLRPAGARVRTTNGVASGPVSFMRIFNEATDVVKQGGTRRGANMAVLRVDHPDILEFIRLKGDMDEMRNFNISVAVTDEFMDALRDGGVYILRDPRDGSDCGTLNAQSVFDELVHHAWLTGDPGVVFIDRANATNPARHVETLEATNPCGEQWLAPYDSCNLGSINVARFVGYGEFDTEVDWQRLGETVRECVHFLDNVIDANRYPIDEIRDKTLSNRRIGLGVMGFADMLISLRIPYDSPEGVEFGRKLMRFIHDTAKDASADLAKVRGNFPNHAQSWYAGPMRNVAVDTVAPTGTISMIADCSSGIEPLFGVAFTKTVMDGTALTYVHPAFEAAARREGWHSDELMRVIAERGSVQHIDAVPDWAKRVFRVAADIAPAWHVRMQAAFQESVDNAISKTINFASTATESDVAEAYMLAYESSCKGITVFRDGSRDEQVLTTGSTVLRGRGVGDASATDPVAAPRPRPYAVPGVTYRARTPYGNMYVTVNDDPDTGKPFEVFATIGKSGGFFAAQSEAVCRLASLALRSGVSKDEVADQLRGIRGPDSSWHAGDQILSLPDAIGRIIASHGNGAGAEWAVREPTGVASALVASIANDGRAPVCVECGSVIEISEGCRKCRSCGYTACG